MFYHAGLNTIGLFKNLAQRQMPRGFAVNPSVTLVNQPFIKGEIFLDLTSNATLAQKCPLL